MNERIKLDISPIPLTFIITEYIFTGEEQIDFKNIKMPKITSRTY